LSAAPSDEQAWDLEPDAAEMRRLVDAEDGRRALAGIERADSVVLDPHKGLFLPYGNGALVVRDEQALRRAHSAPADYLPEAQDDPDRIDFCELLGLTAAVGTA